MLSEKGEKLNKLERLAYLKDIDPSYKPMWEKLKQELWPEETKEDKYKHKLCEVIWPSGRVETYKSTEEAKRCLNVSNGLMIHYLNSGKPVKQGKFKGFMFNRLEENE